jgi:site-specific recombinase XerD
MLIRDVIDLFIQNRRNNLGAAKSTVETYRYALKQFADFMEDNRNRVTYEEINRVDIAAFNEHLKDVQESGAWSRSKFLLVVKVLKVMFGWIESDDDCKEDGLKSWKAKMPKGGKTPMREFIPSHKELGDWQRAFNTNTVCGIRDKLIFSTLMETGMRRGELCTLKVEHVMLGTSTMYVNGKTGPRTIAITPELAALIKTYLKKRARTVLGKSPYLLPSTKSLDKPVDADYITKVFRRVRQRTGLAHVTPHTLRHAFCTYYQINGGSIESMRVNTGHKTYEAMIHYMHLAKVHGKQQHDDMAKGSLLKMLRSS